MEVDEKIIKILFDEKKVQKKDLIGVFKIHNANKVPLEKLVVDLKVAKREDVLEVKAKIYDVEPYSIDISKINMDIATNIPQAMAKRYNIACPDVTSDGKMIIAMHDPKDSFALEYVQMRTGKEVKLCVALLADLEDAWEVIYASESKKKHPFFTKKAEDAKAPAKKQIPDKFVIPSLSKRVEVIVKDTEKAQTAIREATDTLREKAKEDSRLNTMVDSIQTELEALTILSQSATVLNLVMDEEEIIKKILETGKEICKAETASLLVLDEEKQFLIFKEALAPKREKLLDIHIPMSEESIARWVVLNRSPLAVNNVKNDPRHFKEIDELIDFETRNIACVPIQFGGEVLGVMELLNKSTGDFNEKDLEYLSILASQASIALRNAAQIDQLNNFYIEVVEILIDCLESLETVTRDHSLRVARLATAIAKQMNLPESEYEKILYASFLHDIGKIKVSKEDMKNHPTEGARMLSHIKFFQAIAPIVRHHHERFDGSGYPDGLSGESIPIGARILAVAEGYIESFDQKAETSEQEHLEEFLKEFGSAYDPSLKLVFLSILSPSSTE